jgi:hypothetical protein
VAAVTFEHTGRIPLWNSWMGRGEPLLENSFSYVNNPLMFLPVLAWGPYDGAKIAVIAHAVIAGLGGWMLAYLAGLKTAGRLLSAGLFAGHGGIVGAIGMGFYQMSLSQAYVPWIYAGTIGTLRRRDRWSVGLLVVGTALLLFAGTFWYALPTAIGVALLVGFGLFEHDAAGRIRLNAVALRRIAVAAVLIGAVAAVRLIPQAVNHEYVTHVEEYFPNPPRDFGWTAGLYFSPTMPPDSQISSLYFFYTLSPVFLILLLVGRTLIIPVGGKTPGTGRLIIPAAIAWLDSAAGAATAQRLGIPVPVPANVGECQPGQQLPVAQISSPIAGQTVQGTIAITGTITALDFNRYQIELAPANTQNWVLVAGPFGNQVTNSQLASFDTTRVPNGEYQLRLTAFSNAGGYLYRTVNILISNVLPTATPTLLPTAPPAILPTFGPVIPTFPPVFETPLPFPTLGPTPTLDFGP